MARIPQKPYDWIWEYTQWQQTLGQDQELFWVFGWNPTKILGQISWYRNRNGHRNARLRQRPISQLGELARPKSFGHPYSRISFGDRSSRNYTHKPSPANFTSALAGFLLPKIALFQRHPDQPSVTHSLPRHFQSPNSSSVPSPASDFALFYGRMRF